MKTKRTPILILAGTCLLIGLAVNRTMAQGQDGNSVLKLPGLDGNTPSTPAFPSALNGNPQAGSSVLNMFPNQLQQPPESGPGFDQQAWQQMQDRALAKLAPRSGLDPNQDILVTPDLGLWMISVTSYTGDDAPKMARHLVSELRQGPYRQPAYVFNFGAEERRKEYERVRNLIEQQRQFFQTENRPLNQPLRIRHMRIEEQCGVLIGGFADEKQARQHLDKLRKLPPLDPSRVHLHATVTGTFDPSHPERVDQMGRTYIDPLQQAFLVRNPTMPVQRPSEWDQLDVNVLRKLNADEPYSLFKCRKPVTLAITQFETPTVVQSRSSAGGFLESVGLAKKSVDGAAVYAHNLADVLNKNCGLKAYVLHTQYSSVVAVGEFASADDPEMREMQQLLRDRLKLGNIPLFATPMPMQVPH
jgi:hypothetical protein